jgi:CDP-diacylglycerol--serine O-phosphatidyltransferase
MPRMQTPRVRPNFRRGIFVVPTLLTVLNIFFGFRCIVYSTRALEAMAVRDTELALHSFEIACLSILIAAVFDTFDGLVARSLHATSEFGKEYDSLADMVTFGVAPAVLVYAWALHTLDRLGGGIAFLFMAAVSLRLARFNVITGKSDYRWFVGLPSPAGALVIASMIFYAPRPVTERPFALIVMVVTIFTAFSMVSPIRWRSQKGVTVQKERSLIWFLGVALIVAIAFFRPRESGFLAAVGYLASGPLVKLWSLAFPRAVPAVAPAVEEHAPLPTDGGGP